MAERAAIGQCGRPTGAGGAAVVSPERASTAHRPPVGLSAVNDAVGILRTSGVCAQSGR